MVVAIDGPAGCGKSTVAKLVAEKTGFLFLNSGSFYRGITLAFQRWWATQCADCELTLAGSAPLEVARSLALDYAAERLHINGEDVEDLLHSDSVDTLVSQVSAIGEIRSLVNAKLKEIAASRDVVCEGRDMCTVVFPEAECQFYLDASVEVQAERRFKQGVSALSLAEIRSAIVERDELDKKKAQGALKIAEKAVYIDTSHLTISEVCEIILHKITLKE